MKHVMLLSGGFDSTLGLARLVHEYGKENVVGIFFNLDHSSYEREKKSVKYFTEKYDVPYYELHLHVDRTSKREKPGRNPLMILRATNFLAKEFEGDDCTIYTMDEWNHNEDYPYGYPKRTFSVSCDVGDYKGLMTQLVEGETQNRIHFEMPVRQKSLLWTRPWIKKYNYTLEDLQQSVSCYNGNGCGECYACGKRKFLEDVVFNKDVAPEFPWDRNED